MKILVTGGAGYIGTVLLPMLLNRKYQVTVLDNLMYGGTQLLPYLMYKNFQLVKEDIRNKTRVKKICRDKDIIIHLAAIVGYAPCRKDPILASEVNVVGSKNIASCLGTKQYLIFASTNTNYGAIKDKICTEESPLNPQSIYGKTKTAAETILLKHANSIVYRFATGFGVSPRLRLDTLINQFVYQAVREKYLVVYEANFIRSFIHVNDMARAILFALDHLPSMIGQIYNVGSHDLNYSKRDICEMIARETNVYVHFADVGQDADKRNYIVSYAKIKKLGFGTTVTIKRGIQELIRAVPIVEITSPYSNS